MNSNQQVIIELKSGTKCEGILVNIDKERMVINLSSVKRISLADDGSEKEESLPTLEISKEDIKEVKIVQFQKNEESDKHEIKQNANLNAIPQNLQKDAINNQNKGRSYDKTDSFFDTLTPMSNKDAQVESIRYNDKNCETFDLPKDSNSGNHYNNFDRRQGNYRSRYKNTNQRGGYNNYHNKNAFHQGGGNYNDFNNNSSYHSQNFQGGNNYGMNNSYRGGRGRYNNNAQNQGFNARRNFNNNNSNYQNFQQPNHNNSQFQRQVQMFGGDNSFPSEFHPNNNFYNFNQQQGFSGGHYNNHNGQNFSNQRGRGQNRRNFNRGGNKNFNNRIPNPDFNSINENNDINDQLDDDYNMSIYDKPSSNLNAGSNPKAQGLSMYNPEETGENMGSKSIYDKN